MPSGGDAQQPHHRRPTAHGSLFARTCLSTHPASPVAPSRKGSRCRAATHWHVSHTLPAAQLATPSASQRSPRPHPSELSRRHHLEATNLADVPRNSPCRVCHRPTENSLRMIPPIAMHERPPPHGGAHCSTDRRPTVYCEMNSASTISTCPLWLTSPWAGQARLVRRPTVCWEINNASTISTCPSPFTSPHKTHGFGVGVTVAVDVVVGVTVGVTVAV